MIIVVITSSAWSTNAITLASFLENLFEVKFPVLGNPFSPATELQLYDKALNF